MKKLSLLLAALIVTSMLVACLTVTASAAVPQMEPAADDRALYLDGRANGFAQWPKFTDNGDGTYAVEIKNGNNDPVSWNDDVYNNQWTNQNSETVTWNLYFPRVYYASGVSATELCWGLMEMMDSSDLEDFEIYYSDDAVSWKKVKNVTIATYTPAAVNGRQEFDKNLSPMVGVRFIFDRAIEAKYFFAYDPNPTLTNIMSHTYAFVAANGVTIPAEGGDPGEDPGANPGNPNSNTADPMIVSLAVVLASAAGAALVIGKKKK